jgi:citrate lyase subunit beta/citryl-CoA lyase
MAPSLPRSLLFMPASRPDFVAKAHLRGADAIILDLEDGVAAKDKAAARAALARMHADLTAQGLPVWVRVNALDHGGREDLDVIAALPEAPIVMLPKVETPTHVQAARDQLQAPIVPLIETPAGVIHAAEIAAASPDVFALAFGSEDFAAALGVEPTAEALTAPAQWVVLAAAAQGLPAFGLPGSLASFSDIEALSRLAERAAGIGFAGALCIHPTQVAVVNRCFSPTLEQIAWAMRIVGHVSGASGGASALEGQMVDPPILARAQRIIQRART